MGSRRRTAALVAGAVLAIVPAAAAQRGGDESPPKAAATRLVYADFEQTDGGKAISVRGGGVTVSSYQEVDLQKTTVKGAADGSNAPELVRIKPDDPNHLAKFDFAFKAPNQWAGAGLEIKGQPDVDGKTPFDDVSGYKTLTFQLYGKGVESVRVEAISRGHGVDLPAGYPQMLIKLRPGLNTYEVALKALAQPPWVEIKQDTRKILQKLTAVSITAYCEGCRPTEGMLIVDNVAFEK